MQCVPYRAPTACPCGTAAAPSSRWRRDRLSTCRPPAWRGWHVASAKTSSGRDFWPGTPTSLSTQWPSRQSVRDLIPQCFCPLQMDGVFSFKVLLYWICSGALRLPDGPKKPVALKPVDRKPLESVVRYLGKKKAPRLFCLSFWCQAVLRYKRTRQQNFGHFD